VRDAITKTQQQLTQPSTGIIGEKISITEDLKNKLQIVSANKTSFSNNSHTNSPNNTSAFKPLVRTQFGSGNASETPKSIDDPFKSKE
jgi:hypothetical protein